MHAFIFLALATFIPPHARVNYKCYPVWNSARSNLDVVWNGAKYTQPWQFYTETNGTSNTCEVATCVQRLWCTDSGAAGYYNRNHERANVPLYYTWLRNTTLRGQRLLAVQGQEGDNITMAYTSWFGHGTLLVMGSTLYFYTFDYVANTQRKYGLPRLTSLVFAEYQAGRTADQLVTQQLTAFNVLGYGGRYDWSSGWSPIYPAGKNALTVSVGSNDYNDSWAVDVSLTVSGATAARRALVHYCRPDVPSVISTSREVLTVPGFSCRAFTNGTAPKCFRIGEAATKYTWAPAATTVLDMRFAPLSSLASFSLPAALWLHNGYNNGFVYYRLIATYGLGSVVAFDGSTFFGVETRAQSGCATGSGLFLVSYDVSRSAPAQKTLSASLGCANTQDFPLSYTEEVAYEAGAVKWLGPFADHYVLFAAKNVSAHEYYQYNASVSSTCPPGRYREAGRCQPCPVGFFCPGTLDSTDEKRVCPRFSYADSRGMERCAVSAAYFFRYPGSVELCTSGYYCPGGLSDPIACPAGRPRCDNGCWREAQCHK